MLCASYSTIWTSGKMSPISNCIDQSPIKNAYHFTRNNLRINTFKLKLKINSEMMTCFVFYNFDFLRHF